MTGARSLLDELDGPGGLDGAEAPARLRRLPAQALPHLADEIRTRLIDTVTVTGGHLGPNLGVVELTIAVHRCFDSPYDAIVWDTGHQAYVHKMLTGRAGELNTLRANGGLSGYPSRRESTHDVVENSHASTSLSYADGLAKGFALAGEGRRVVAVIGDGALTGGMAWEALNNIGQGRRPVVVVLNDNGRSYAPTVGALAAHLSHLRAGTASGNLFRDMGFDYLGPIDGHDVGAVERALTSARGLGRPVVVHCVTAKGSGYAPAESDEADRLHTVRPRPTLAVTNARPSQSWTSVFEAGLLDIAERRPDVVALTAAMERPTGLHAFAQRFPDRVFDVGIAEQHAVTSAAGLAMAGCHPVVAIYSTFLSRAFDQVLMDVALHRLPVTLVLDRSGVTGPDGPSHHGMWDLAWLGLVPGLRIAAPRDGERLRQLLAEAVTWDGPSVVRFPTGAAPAALAAEEHMGGLDVLMRPPGRSALNADVLIAAAGPMAAPAVQACVALHREGVSATVVDPRWVHPPSAELVRLAAQHRVVVTVEDGLANGGFGDSLARALRERDAACRLVALGLPDAFLPAGQRGELLAEHGLTCAGIVDAAHRALGSAPQTRDLVGVRGALRA